MERRIRPILTLAVVWAITWPTAVVLLMVVLTGIMGGGQDVGPLDVIAILTPLALAAGLLFGLAWTLAASRLPQRPAVRLVIAAVLGMVAAIVIGILAGITTTAVYNAANLGALAGPISVVTMTILERRREAPRARPGEAA